MTDYPIPDSADLVSAAAQAAAALEFGPDAMKAAFELAYPPQRFLSDAELVKAQQALLDGMLAALMVTAAYAAMRCRTTPATFLAETHRALTEQENPHG